MSVPNYTQADEAAGALFDYAVNNPDNMPEELRVETLNSLKPHQSLSFAVSEFAERVFALGTKLPKGVVAMGAACANVAAFHRINNFADDDGKRGRGIAAALHRRYGTPAMPGTRWPAKEEDPSPKQAYLPQAAEATDVPMPGVTEPGDLPPQRPTGNQ